MKILLMVLLLSSCTTVDRIQIICGSTGGVLGAIKGEAAFGKILISKDGRAEIVAFEFDAATGECSAHVKAKARN